LGGINAFLRDEVQTVASANSKYAEDPSTYRASFGLEEHFYQGLDEFNGSPDGGNIEAQMHKEFWDTRSFVTRNYGGVETDLLTEWQFVVAPQIGKVYPGEIGLPRADGTLHPGRQRKSMKQLMMHPLTVRAGLLRVEVLAVRLYTVKTWFFCI